MSDDWRPISTAPRDGTPVWLFIKGHCQVEAWFAPGEWSTETPIAPAEYDGAAWVCADDAFQVEVEEWPEGFHDFPATHWRPLPAPPQNTGEA